MTLRNLIALIGIAASIFATGLIVTYHRELASLRVEEQQLRQQAPEVMAAVANAQIEQHTPSAELLRLRGEVGKIERRKRELAGAHAENGKLRAHLATKGTNAAGGMALPAGYIRKTDAKLAGFNTPEDTIQSMLWAMQNRDVAGFLQTFEPQMAKAFEARLKRSSSTEEFFKDVDALPGLRIRSKRDIDNGEVELTIEVIPGEEFPRPLYIKNFDGQWKLISGL